MRRAVNVILATGCAAATAFGTCSCAAGMLGPNRSVVDAPGTVVFGAATLGLLWVAYAGRRRTPC